MTSIEAEDYNLHRGSKTASEDGGSKTASEDEGSITASEDEGSKTEVGGWWIHEPLLFDAAASCNNYSFDSIPPAELSTAFSLRDRDCRSVLHAAAEWDSIDTLNYIAKSAKNLLNSEDIRGAAPIHLATSYGHVAIVKELIALGADVNLKDFCGLTPLHYAAGRGELKVAEVLLSNGADINAKDKVKCTPLHKAAGEGELELCEFLLQQGAEIDAVDQAGQTPLTHAVLCDYKEVVLFLISKGADMAEKEEYVVLDTYPSDYLDETSDLRKEWELKIRKSTRKEPRSYAVQLSGVGLAVNCVCGGPRRTTDATTLKNANIALSWYNEQRLSRKRLFLQHLSGVIEKTNQVREYELVNVVGGTVLISPIVYHCNFIAMPKNGRKSEKYLFFAEVKCPSGNLICTVCSMIGRTRHAKTGLRGCIICKDFPGLIQHPRRKNAFTKCK